MCGVLNLQVIATRNTRERSNRLENMCWRIWHLARKKKQVSQKKHLRIIFHSKFPTIKANVPSPTSTMDSSQKKKNFNCGQKIKKPKLLDV